MNRGLPSPVVSRWRLLPSRSTTARLYAPADSRRKTICLPSGENEPAERAVLPALELRQVVSSRAVRMNRDEVGGFARADQIGVDRQQDQASVRRPVVLDLDMQGVGSQLSQARADSTNAEERLKPFVALPTNEISSPSGEVRSVSQHPNGCVLPGAGPCRRSRASARRRCSRRRCLARRRSTDRRQTTAVLLTFASSASRYLGVRAIPLDALVWHR